MGNKYHQQKVSINSQSLQLKRAVLSSLPVGAVASNDECLRSPLHLRLLTRRGPPNINKDNNKQRDRMKNNNANTALYRKAALDHSGKRFSPGRKILNGLILYVAAMSAQGGYIPELSKSVEINAGQQGYNVFFDLLSQKLGIPVVLENNLNGSEDTNFTGTRGELIDTITSKFNLATYYDGNALYVYEPDRLSQKIIRMSRGTAEELLEQIYALNLPDDLNQLWLHEAGLLLSGTPQYINQVSQLADRFAQSVQIGNSGESINSKTRGESSVVPYDSRPNISAQNIEVHRDRGLSVVSPYKVEPWPTSQ